MSEEAKQRCGAIIKRNGGADVCKATATEALVENGDYVPVCEHHAMIARRNHWAVGRLRDDENPQIK